MTNLNSKLLFGLLMTSMLFGCSVEQSKKEKPVSEEIVYEQNTNRIEAAEMVELEKKAVCNSEPCTTISIAYPRFESYPNFNKVIENKIVKTLSEDFIMDADGSESIEELENMFIASYEDFVANFPESTTPWDLTLDISTSFSNENFISLMMSTSSYTGGAHPNGFVEFINLSKSSKKALDLDDLIENKRELTKLAEDQFRQHYEISAGDALSDYGFTFENDQFTLPESIGFNEKGMILYYNSYEIAPHSNGPTDLTIPFRDIKEYLKI